MDFSVIMPAYNVSAVIERAIRSAAAQSLPPLEILVIDDCSTDNTVGVVEALRREIPSLRLLSTPVNSGPSAARNVGFRAAKADWVALLDADDAWKQVDLSDCPKSPVPRRPTLSPTIWCCGTPSPTSHTERAYFDLPEPLKQITLLDMFRADDNFNFSRASFTLMQPICRRKFLADHKLEYNESMKIGEDFVLYVESSV